MDIMNMTVDQILMLNGLVPVAKEAKDASDIIIKAFEKAFGINEDKIMVWSDRDDYNHEYLTHDGIWQARYLHQTYDVKCTPDEIFKYFRAEYLIRNGYAQRISKNGCLTEEGKLEEVVRYFRSFVSKTQHKLEEEQK